MKHFPKFKDENSTEEKIREEYWVKSICPFLLYDYDFPISMDRLLNLLWYESMGGKDTIITTTKELSIICKINRKTIGNNLQLLADKGIIKFHDYDAFSKKRSIRFCKSPQSKSDKALAWIYNDIERQMNVKSESEDKEEKSKSNSQNSQTKEEAKPENENFKDFVF